MSSSMLSKMMSKVKTVKFWSVLAVLMSGLPTFSAHSTDLDLNVASNVPMNDVASLESNPGEDKAAFMHRVARVAEAYTTKTGHEVCGWVAFGGKSLFSIRLVTLNSQIACGVPESHVVEGYFAGSEMAHSHPNQRHIRLTALDKKLRGHLLLAGNATESVDNCHFSPMDFTHPGYLFACGKVLYQRGQGSEVENLETQTATASN